jgi:8-oxo-dGTP pyrophosphatase MutT (NUDIX family)
MNNCIKRGSPCLNCGKIGHEQKQCKDAITSWGIILVKTDEDLQHFNTDIKKYENFEGIRIYNKKDLFLASENMQKLKFLLIQRKHSLGFSEFIRGKYKIDNINGIRGLFNQMVPEELALIRELTLIKENIFDDLWNYFWGTNEIDITFNKREYLDSKNKFLQLNSRQILESDLEFYLDTANPNYPTPEWGFPKGRKKRGESDLSCAIREFCEETDIKESDINIIKNIKPIEEELIGTNGIKYRHVYYLAELKKEKKNFFNDRFNINNSEIGDIGFFTYDESIELIRDYHVEKKSILGCIMNYYMELSKKSINEKKEEWAVEMDC